MAKTEKTYKIMIKRYRFGGEASVRYEEGTLEELIKYFSYTLEVGESWQHEKGNKKINCNPKSAKSLVTNLNNAKANAAANGCPNTYYELVA